MMNPTVQDIIMDPDTDVLKFTLKNLDVSLANAIRRTILSDIPTLVFKTTPYEENKTNILVNTTRFNNEIIKQRLSCIPIHINDNNFPYQDYVVELDVSNDTDNIIYITTNDFKIKNKITDSYLSESEVNLIFPPNKITNDYIVIARLRPRINNDILGEKLKLTAEFEYSTAKVDGAFNVASTCFYTNTLDKIKINNLWNEKEKSLKSKNISLEEIETIKNDWYTLDAKRIFIHDSFDFNIKTLGVFNNFELVEKACNIIMNKLKLLLDDLSTDKELIQKSNITIENCFDIKLINEDYTIGKIIEYMLYYSHYINDNGISDNTITFCGFKKPHPHINESIIRVAFVDEVDTDVVINYISNSINNLNKIYTSIISNFTDK